MKNTPTVLYELTCEALSSKAFFMVQIAVCHTHTPNLFFRLSVISLVRKNVPWQVADQIQTGCAYVHV